MNANRHKGMIVEDAVENQQLLEVLLEDEYELSIADSAERCLERLPGVQPDLILLDIGLPGMNGYDVCREVKGNKDTEDIPIIFVTGKATTEERLAGFEAGGDEYVTKPFSAEDLLMKVKMSLQTKQDENYLRSTIEEAQKLTQQALVSSSELSVLNVFMQQSGQAMSYEELAGNILRATRSLGLQCCVSVRHSMDTNFFGCQADSLEARLIEKSKHAERFVERHVRTVVNAHNCSLLVRNMPHRDEERYARLKHHLASIIDSSAARIETLEELFDAKAQRNSTIRQLVRTNEKRMNQIQGEMAESNSERERLLGSLLFELEESLTQSGLDARAHEELLDKIASGIRQIVDLPDQRRSIERSFNQTKDTLNRLIG